MSIALEPPSEKLPAVEWPTLALVLVIHAAMLALTWFHDSLPVLLWLVLAGWFSAWWGSAQHEMLHGHPTRRRDINTALASAPYWLWLPFERYRQTHLTHHRDERLTDPLDDPESRYVAPDAWAAHGALMRMLIRSQGTMVGRLTIGPVLAPVQFLLAEAKAIQDGDKDLARIWAQHGLITALWCVWVFAIAGVPLWQYLLGVVYIGTALALVRSFCEHRAHSEVGWRTAIVERSPIFGILFLFNNLHVVHHRWPSVPWYRLPALYRRHRQAFLAANGGLVYRGYGEVLRRFAFRHHHVPVHPLGRIPASQNTASPAGEPGLRVDRGPEQLRVSP